MTKAEAANILSNNIIDGHVDGNARFMDAFWFAVDNLKAEPCEDAVSLDAVINTIEWYRTNPQHFTEDNLIEDMKGLTPVTPKPTECEDAVSREAVTDTIIWYENGGMIGTKELLELIRRLPSVQPTKKGRWILDREISIVFSVFRCSNCKSLGANEHFNFCPNCGADMRGGE